MNNCTLSLKKRSKLQSTRTFLIRIFPSEPPCSRKTEKSSPERISKTDLSGLRTAPSAARFLPPPHKAYVLLSRSRSQRPHPIIRSVPAARAVKYSANSHRMKRPSYSARTGSAASKRRSAYCIPTTVCMNLRRTAAASESCDFGTDIKRTVPTTVGKNAKRKRRNLRR